MDISTTESVVLRRETKVVTFSPDQIRGLALAAGKNAVDPSNTATFGKCDAAPNADGSITVSMSIETTIPDPAIVASPAPALVVQPIP